MQPLGLTGTRFKTRLSPRTIAQRLPFRFYFGPHVAAAVLDLEHVAIEIGDPLPPFHRKLQIPKCAADVGLNLAPEEARITLGEIGWAGVAKTRVAPDLLEFMKQSIKLPRIKRIGKLTDEIRSPQDR